MSGTEEITVLVQRLEGNEDLPSPTYMTPHAAGMDLCAAVTEEVVLRPGARTLVPTGLRLAIPEGYEGQIRPRSGLALRHGLTLLNTPGTIDADYRGEVQIIVANLGEEDFIIRRGERIAQLVVSPVARAKLEFVDELEHTPRGEGGFGHTG
ncbi:MAG: dUTP diphosphatase [Armatimonadetes bacterium]|nr:dUTP diphosphatase [Armatimonadota bacterium]NIO74610.1 dUTP diphosphatase [Armatimonadota bacterium]NIO96565.1 dUTP diphosphatase [Armatimonadota bacterium]